MMINDRIVHPLGKSNQSIMFVLLIYRIQNIWEYSVLLLLIKLFLHFWLL